MKQSAGLLLYRKSGKDLEVLLVHPGGPFWAKKDKGSWSIPKGEFAEGEEPLVAAKREFSEEVGVPAPTGDYTALAEAKQPSGKIVHAFMLEADVDLAHFASSTFEMEWPPKSGKTQTFPEVDRAAWVDLAEARQKLVPGQVVLLDGLAEHLQIAIDFSSQPVENPQTSLL